MTTPSLPEMATELRKAGSEFEIGQVWVPTRLGSKAKRRAVTFLGDVPGMKGWGAYDQVGYCEVDGARPTAFDFNGVQWDSHCERQSFRAWVRKHAARPVTP